MSEVIAILITGSNQGLGFETARQLSKLPHVHLFLSGRDPIRVREASGKITTEEGCQALVDEVIIDVANDDTIKMAHTEVESKLQGKALDVLIVSSSDNTCRQMYLNNKHRIEQRSCIHCRP